MTVIVLRNDLVKGALIAYLKTITAITDKLDEYGSGAEEIRESQWQAQDFLYPSIRLRMIRNVPEEGNCKRADFSVSWMVFTEDQSSATCDEISGIIATYFQSRQFSVSFQGSTYHVSLTGATLIPALRAGVTVWRSEVLLEGFVSIQ